MKKFILVFWLLPFTFSLAAGGLTEIDEVARSLGGISEVYTEMKGNTHWSSEGFSGTLLYSYTTVSDFRLRYSDLPERYYPYLTSFYYYDVDLNIMRGMFNTRVKRFSSFNLYCFGAYYAHNTSINYKPDNDNEAEVKSKHFGDYYHNLMPGFIFDLNAFPARFMAAPVIEL